MAALPVIKETDIPGCLEITPKVQIDCRGTFVKTYQSSLYIRLGLHADFVEEYHSRSKRRVLRGLHFQVPPHAHFKVVYCVQGSALDAIVDLRVGSPTYGQYYLIELSAATGNMLYLPPGIAHGFYVNSREAILAYRVSTEYVPAADTGILWNSANIPWADDQPIMSARDQSLPKMADFDSPFAYLTRR
jgi:dTDP-4-dehydrorhamnose 3,5-epimerase